MRGPLLRGPPGRPRFEGLTYPGMGPTAHPLVGLRFHPFQVSTRLLDGRKSVRLSLETRKPGQKKSMHIRDTKRHPARKSNEADGRIAVFWAEPSGDSSCLRIVNRPPRVTNDYQASECCPSREVCAGTN